MKIKKLKQIINKKDEGFLDDFLPLLIFLLIAAIMLLLFIETSAAINKKSSINAIARQYMLRLETQGCLTDADVSDLVDALNKEGFTDENGNPLTTSQIECDYSEKGTNNTAGYGNEVFLRLNVYTEQWIINPNDTDIWKIIFKKTYNPISIEYHSTSKE